MRGPRARVWRVCGEFLSAWWVYEFILGTLVCAWSMVNQCVRRFMFVGKFSQW